MAKKPKYDSKALAAIAAAAAGGKSLAAARRQIEQVYAPLFASYRTLLGYENLFEMLIAFSSDALQAGLSKDTPQDKVVNGFIKVWQKQTAKIKDLTELLEQYEWQPDSNETFASHRCPQCNSSGYPRGFPTGFILGVPPRPPEELIHYKDCPVAHVLGRKTKPRGNRK